MSKTVIGADVVMRKLAQLKAMAPQNIADANHKSGEELIRLSKILIPAPTGTNRALIHGTANADGSYLCDFGPKAKVIEENRPFVNPALAVTRKKHKARAKRAIKKAVKDAFGG
jgi:hypothetical protein